MAEYLNPVPTQLITGLGDPLPLQVKMLFVIVGLFAFVKSRPEDPARKKLLLSSLIGFWPVTKFPWIASLPIDPAAHGCSGTQVVSPNGTELPNVMFSTSRALSAMTAG